MMECQQQAVAEVDGRIAKLQHEATEAEDWLGTFFSDLRHAGAARVTLLADDTPIFGPMELSPAEEAEGERS